MLLVVAAIVTDLFMVKLYVLIHKKEFLYLEEQMIEMRRRGRTIKCVFVDNAEIHTKMK